MLRGVLSNNTDWAKVERVIPELRDAFAGFDLGTFAATTDSEIHDRIVPWFKRRKAGSMTLRRSLLGLRDAALILRHWSNAHGSAEDFFLNTYSLKGSQKSGVSSAPAPSSGHDRCFYCHTDTSQRSHHGFSGTITGTKDVWTVDLRDNVVDETKVTPETMDSIKKFVETMSKPAPEVIESFKKPKETFMPEGLLSVLAERCDAIGKTDKK